MMRIGAAISVVVHVTLVVTMLVLAGVRPFKPTPAEAITVDIVAEKDAPEKPKFDVPVFDFSKTEDKSATEEKSAEKKPEDKSQEKPPEKSQEKPAEKPPEKIAEQKPPEKPAPMQQAQQAPQKAPAPSPAPPPPAVQQLQQQQPQQQALEQQPPPQAAPIPYADLTQKFASLTGADNSDFDAKATASANISLDSAKALRERLRECSILPPSVSPEDNVKIVLRVSLRRDGRIAGEPLLIEASASEKGPALMQSAMKALSQCAPFSMLPADKYNQWKMLDLSFTPKDFRRG